MLDLTSWYIFEICYQVHMYVDSREKVTARYQVTTIMNYCFNNLDVAWYSIIFIIDFGFVLPLHVQLTCPSKREMLVFGSFKQTGTLLPKAPKGWGWRTALLFDELADLLQNGALRVIAVVQLVWIKQVKYQVDCIP